MFPLNWNIPFIRKNGSRTTLGAITGDIAGIEEDVAGLTEDSDLVKANLFPQGKRSSLSIYCAYDGYTDSFSASVGITKTTTLEALLRKICNTQQESGEILIATNYDSPETNTPAFLATICNDFSVNGILYISIHVSSIVRGRFYVEVKDSGLTYIKRGYYDNFALSGNVKTQTL